MSGLMSRHVDPAKEKRLRRWARTNYVPVSERKGSWHPIVLEEMGLRDLELERESLGGEAFETPFRPVYVPLEPTDHHRLDGLHQLPDVPNYQRVSKPVEHWVLG